MVLMHLLQLRQPIAKATEFCTVKGIGLAKLQSTQDAFAGTEVWAIAVEAILLNLVLDWRKRQQSRAAVRLAIKETLDHLPQSYSAEIYEQKCEQIYQHIYDSYQEDAVFTLLPLDNLCVSCLI
jgi:hypothetical protein